MWSAPVLSNKNKTFLEYCTSTVKEGPNGSIDAFQVVMIYHFLGRNITLLYRKGDKWSADPDILEDIVFVYNGENQFVPTDVDTYFFQYCIPHVSSSSHI